MLVSSIVHTQTCIYYVYMYIYIYTYNNTCMYLSNRRVYIYMHIVFYLYLTPIVCGSNFHPRVLDKRENGLAMKAGSWLKWWWNNPQWWLVHGRVYDTFILVISCNIITSSDMLSSVVKPSQIGQSWDVGAKAKFKASSGSSGIGHTNLESLRSAAWCMIFLDCVAAFCCCGATLGAAFCRRSLWCNWVANLSKEPLRPRTPWETSPFGFARRPGESRV